MVSGMVGILLVRRSVWWNFTEYDWVRGTKVLVIHESLYVDKITFVAFSHRLSRLMHLILYSRYIAFETRMLRWRRIWDIFYHRRTLSFTESSSFNLNFIRQQKYENLCRLCQKIVHDMYLMIMMYFWGAVKFSYEKKMRT